MDGGVKFEGNVFVFLEEIFQKNTDTVNKDTEMQYMGLSVKQGEYQQQLQQWQADGSSLATAGKKDSTHAPGALNGAGIAFVAVGVVVALLIGIAAATGALGAMLTAMGITAPIGAALVGVTLLIIMIAVALEATIYALARAGMTSFSDPGKQGENSWGLTDKGVEIPQFDQNVYGEAQTKVQRDQTRVQQTQNEMNQVYQQFITPNQDTKTSDANMVNAALHWLSGVVGQWTAA